MDLEFDLDVNDPWLLMKVIIRGQRERETIFQRVEQYGRKDYIMGTFDQKEVVAH